MIMIIMGIALAYALLMLRIEERHPPRRKVDDEVILRLVAFENECAICDLFVNAGAAWSFSNSKIDSDFNRYLRLGEIPHYVSTYVRGQCPARPSYQSTLFIGYRPPLQDSTETDLHPR